MNIRVLLIWANFFPISLVSSLQGSQLFLAIKFKVLSRFCAGQKGHSPGFNRHFLHQKADPKGVLKLQEHKTWKKSVAI